MAPKLSPKKAREAIKNIRREIRDYFQKHNLKYAVFGKSMGVDSSVVAGLLAQIHGIKPIGVIMPCESDDNDERIGRLVLNYYKIPIIKVDLTSTYHSVKSFLNQSTLNQQILKAVEKNEISVFKKRLVEKEKFALGNIKARLRMITLYHLAQLTGGLVISTGNYSESLLGFTTLHGDTGDLSPIGEIFKGAELYDIAKGLKVPKESLEAIPADGLGISQYDEDQLGLSYHRIDEILTVLLKKQFNHQKPITKELITKISGATNIPKDKILSVIKRVKQNAFKRKVPIIIKRKAIGLSD